jgi:hypothetical protein
LGIKISGVHRLRTNYAQKVNKELMKERMSNQKARREVSRRLGHSRVEVTGSYVPK